MKKITLILTILFLLFFSFNLMAEKFIVDSQMEFDDALSDANSGDSIVWEAGLFQDIYMNIGKSNLVIMAEELGETKFTGSSKANISGNYTCC